MSALKPPIMVVLAALIMMGGLVGRAAQPNVLFICVDDLKPLLGCYGDSKIKSPNIDRLAARSVLFESAYCNQAVCAPSRNALMTGRRPTTLGVYDLGTFFRKAAPDAVTLAQLFKQHGWRTEALGKIFHVGHGNQDDAASWSVPHWDQGATYALKENVARRSRTTPASVDSSRGQAVRQARGAATENADVADSTYSDGQIAEEAIRRLRVAKAQPAQPFFLAVGFHKPHLPFVAPKKYWDLYDRASFQPHKLQSPPKGAPEFAPTTWGELRNYSDIPDTGPLNPDEQRQLIHGYHAAVSYMDAQLGRVLDELDRLGMTANTIIVLWGDHGWHLGDHGMWSKHTNYEQATRIPLLVSAPGIGKAGSRSRALVETVDVFPTLCELAGLPAPAGLDGASFVNALTNPASARTKDAVFHVFPRSRKETGPILGRAVRTERHRLVEWKAVGAPADTAILELYDYVADPDESKNLSDEQPEVVARLRAILDRQPEAKPQFRASTAGTTPLPNVLFIMTDQQSADAMSFRMGDRYLKTPTLDGLAARGTTFTRAYAANPLCMPSRTSIFTGRYPHATGVTDNTQTNINPAEFVNMGTFFRRAGYRTAYYGKWHQGYDDQQTDTHGFEVVEPAKQDVLTAESAVEFINKKADRPFLMVVSFLNPHNVCELARDESLSNGPIGDPPPLAQLPPLPANAAPPRDEPDSMTLMRQGYHASPLFPVADFTPERWRQLRWGYYRLIEKVDAEIGKVLAALRAADLERNTLIVFTSDHGELAGAHDLNQKTVLYEESVRVPLIVSHPGQKLARVSDKLVNTGIDILPTMLDFAKIARPPNMTGLSLRPLVLGDHVAEWRDQVIVQNNMTQAGLVGNSVPMTEGRMVRTDRYKYCVYAYGEHRESLVDLEQDPGEMVNLARDPALRPILLEHRDRLRRFGSEHRDSLVASLLADAVGPRPFPIVTAPKKPRSVVKRGADRP